MTPSCCNVVVLGAGLTGAGTALELARQGVDVALLGQDETPLNRASSTPGTPVWIRSGCSWKAPAAPLRLFTNKLTGPC